MQAGWNGGREEKGEDRRHTRGGEVKKGM